MRIRTKLTLLFSIITATILLCFVAVMYISAKNSREKEFYSVLTNEAITKANLFFNANVQPSTLHEIYRNNRQTLDEVEVAIYDTAFHLLYHDALDIDFVKETRAMIRQVADSGSLRFYQDQWQVIAQAYPFEGNIYVVTAAAYDQYGYKKLDNLLRSSILLFVMAILALYFGGRFFSQKALGPIQQITERAQQISASNLDLRLPSHQSKDELAELADTFNKMLDRLENSFESQKHFVSNIAHELRTPLSAIITELELSLSKERESAQYQEAIANALSDAQKLAKLSKDLLDLAKANYDPTEIAFKAVRIDEILLDACLQVQKAYPDYHIDIHFENEFEDDRQISVKGNAYLLQVAFANLFENGCKFSSPHQCGVSVSFGADKIFLRFTDKGIGIRAEDLDNIFLPFYRGSNKDFAEGNGIGLPLTAKIVALHKGFISVQSHPNRTTFVIALPNL